MGLRRRGGEGIDKAGCYNVYMIMDPTLDMRHVWPSTCPSTWAKNAGRLGSGVSPVVRCRLDVVLQQLLLLVRRGVDEQHECVPIQPGALLGRRRQPLRLPLRSW